MEGSGNMKVRIPNLISKLERIKREIETTIIYLKEKDIDERPRCSKCGWANLIVRKDKTYLCKSCGYDSRRGN